VEPRETSPYVAPETYDLIYSWLTDDIPFYVEQAKQARGPVLEVGCGTGRILLPTFEAGIAIDGFDLEPGMLEVLRRKAEGLGIKPRVWRADMRDFTMPRRYALITIPFRAFLHNLTTEDEIRTLRCCREHLQPGGRLVFNVFHPSFGKLTEPDGVPFVEKEFPNPETGRTVSLVATAWRDRVNQMLKVEREVKETDTHGYSLTTHRHGFSLRWVYKAEVELLLRAAGFSRWSVLGGFDGRALEQDSDEMVWTAWKD
jgi:SAM-dependent methyltransferase